MLFFLTLYLLPLVACKQVESTIVSLTDTLKVHSLEPNNYVVVLNQPNPILDLISDIVTQVLNTVPDVKPKRKFKNGKMRGFSAVLSSSQLATLKSNPKVSYIEPDATLKIQAIIPPRPSRRGLTTQSSSPWNLARLSHRSKGSNAYVYDSTSGSGTCSYILDTGLYTQHTDFTPNRATLIKNFDTTDNSPDDLSGHGTHVSAILGGQKYGVAKATNIYALKVCNRDGSCNLSDVVAAIDTAVSDSKARASTCPNGVTMTLSFGAPASSWRSMQDSIVAATQAGIFVVAAAGNNGVDVKGVIPASSPFVCSVGASDIDDSKASFSNYGPLISIFAPGVAVQSAWIGSPDANQYLSGTSMSAPHVAGLGAYIMGKQGPQNPLTLCTTIKNLATKNVLSGLPSGTPNRLVYNGAS